MGRDDYAFTPGFPGLEIVAGDGVHLVTADGRRILDAGGGAIVCNVGHGRHEIAEAVSRSLHTVGYVIPPWTTPNRVALRDRLVEAWLPEGFNRVFFCSGGSESVDSAIRLARQHHVAAGRPQRWKVIGRHPSYHGATLATMAAGSHAGRRAGFEPILLDFPKVPWDDAEALAKVIEAEGADTIAAMLVEPIIGSSGAALMADGSYWEAVGSLCQEHGILLIADEVMCGFGRTGRRWGFEHWSIQPDVIVGGKGLAGGYLPLGMVAAAEHVVEPLVAAGQQFMFFTFSAGDAACAAGLATLSILEREDLVTRAATMGERLLDRLHHAFDGHPQVRDIRGRGLMVGVELVGGDRAGLGQAVVTEALARDVWFYPAGSGDPIRDAVLLGPPFTLGDHHIETIVTVLAESLAAATGAPSA